MAGKNEHEVEEEDITPKIFDHEIRTILEKFYGLKECAIKQLRGYDDLNYHCLPKLNENPNIKIVWPHGYVLKIMNSLDSKLNDLCEAQNSMMLFLRENNIPSPLPVKNVSGEYYIKEKLPYKSREEFQREHIVRLLEFQPGIILKSIPKSFSLFYELGIFIAKLNVVLKDFHHPFYKTHHSIWQLHSVPQLKTLTEIIDIPERRNIVKEIVENFSEKVISKENTFERGMIHGDFNEHNVLMLKSKNKEWEVSAILDFGDSHLSCYLYELAVSLCYMMFECKRHDLDPVIGAGHFLAGYLAARSTFVIDYELLKLCICARICQSLVLGLKAFKVHPENTYVLDSQNMGWPLLKELWKAPEEKVAETWKSVIKNYKIRNQLKSQY